MTGEVMDFPNTFDEFANEYGFKDKEEVYTNGSELIQVYRVKQWLEHINETTTMIDKSNFSQEQYKADLQSAYDCGYIKALSDALNALCMECSRYQNGGKCSKCEQYHAILSLSLSEHHKKNIQAYAHDFGVSEEQAEKELQVTTKNNLGVDCISRDEVCRYVAEFVNHEFSTREEEELIDNIITGIECMPSVTPQEPRKGHWIFDGDCLICSKCKKAYSFTGSNFCPNCGADMRGEENGGND